jgi:hypothetical protein
MGPIGCPETSVRNCHYTLRYSPEERSFQCKFLLEENLVTTTYRPNMSTTYYYYYYYYYYYHCIKICGMSDVKIITVLELENCAGGKYARFELGNGW